MLKLLKSRYMLMEDDGGGKGGEYLLMADNVVTPVHNENMDKEMEMVSEPYELQPLGMDSFAPPTHPDLPPTHPDLPPTHPDLPPTHSDLPPTHPDIPPTHPDIPPTHPDIPPTHPDIPPTHSDPAPPARLDSLPPAPQGVPQGVPEGYLSYPAAPHRGEGVHPSNPARLVNNHQQQLQQQQRQLGSLVTDNNMMPQSNEYMQNTRIPPQQNTHPMFLMNNADIMNSSGGSTPVGSNESLSVGSPAGTPDLSGRQPPDLSGRQPPDLSGRQPPKHSVLAAASAKSRRKHDRIMPVESAETKEKYVCPVCKMELFTASSLTKHIRSHNATTPTATNVNSCTICGKVLSSQSSLDRHMLVHSGERPFKCRFCNMSFTTNGNMHRHTRIHEKEGDTPLSQQNNNNAPHSNAIVSKQNRVHSNGSFMPSNGGSSQQQNIPPNRYTPPL